MTKRRTPTLLIVTLTLASFVALTGLVAPSTANAHCDALDGPVVTAARRALEAGDVTLVLPWVRAEDEAAIREAFEHVSAVRALGPEAQELADLYFFETVVRVHRAGEGAPYTGLRPAGGPLPPAIPAVDAALESGSSEALAELLIDAVREGLEVRFAEARERAERAGHSVEAGREYVAAYVHFMHYAVGVYQAASGAAVHDETAEAAEGAVEAGPAEAHQHAE